MTVSHSRSKTTLAELLTTEMKSAGTATPATRLIVLLLNVSLTSADQRRANRAACRAGLLQDELLTLLHEWYEAGWIIKGESTRVAQ